jgi:hypothetical protein
MVSSSMEKSGSRWRAGMGPGEHSVCQFFVNGTHEYVRRHVDGEEAVKVFAHYTSNPASRIGIVTRVTVTDGGNMINLEWVYGKGIVFPPPNKE